MPLFASPDLTRLSQAERDILMLLAEGHTAKSIAALTGRPVNSIHERLRDARRKTGMGSSRELARLLRRQKNRDDEIGVAEASESAPAARSEAPGANAWRRWKGLLMALPIAAAVALAMLSFTPSNRQEAPAAGDPSSAQAFGAADQSPRALHARLLAESRDDAWAGRTEAALRTLYAAVPGVGDDLRVRCGATLCEIAGRAAPTLSDAMRERLVAALQNPPLTTRIGELGLSGAAQSFAVPASVPQLAFAAYWTRKPD